MALTAASIPSIWRLARLNFDPVRQQHVLLYPEGAPQERVYSLISFACRYGWRALKLEGPIPFQEIGVLSALSGSLAGAGLGLFALSTFDTDYILVKETDLAAAVSSPRL